MSVVGLRLKSAREGKRLSLRKFAEEIDEDFTVLWRIERGHRFPPKLRLESFAKVLSLTPQQLEALIAVERRGLNPHELLPEIPPAHISHESIEEAAESVLNKYRRAVKRNNFELPVPVEAVLFGACRLFVEYCDFKREKIPGSSGSLCGCLYPDGYRGKDRIVRYRGKDRIVLVNTGRIRGHQLSTEERRTTAAHEAGHYVLHCGNKESAQLFFRFTKGPTFCRKAECEEELFSPMEYQASVFAACLLMPRKQFVSEWKNFLGSAAKVAESFCVSESFVRFRAKRLGCE